MRICKCFILINCFLDKPVFAELNDTIFIGIEDGCLVIPLQANGHPASISYRWFKNGIPLVFGSNYIIEGSILNFTRLSRTDAGSYSCEAINSEGSSFLNFTVNVQCKYFSFKFLFFQEKLLLSYENRRIIINAKVYYY